MTDGEREEVAAKAAVGGGFPEIELPEARRPGSDVLRLVLDAVERLVGRVDDPEALARIAWAAYARRHAAPGRADFFEEGLYEALVATARGRRPPR